jgi:gliding motility-associated-like protein
VSNSYVFLYAVQGLGACLTSTPISRADALPLNSFVPQIESEPGVYLTDSAGWTEITGQFVAQGGERFITIGWFRDTSTTDYIQLDTIWPDVGAYYYVDGVSLTEKPSLIEVQNVFTPNGDNVNDVFQPRTEYLLAYTCRIYNRWGVKVAELNETDNAWDGSHQNRPCAEGVYYCTIVATGNDDLEYELKGFVQLLR